MKTVRITERTHARLLYNQLEINFVCKDRLNLSEVIDFLCKHYEKSKTGVK